MLKKLFRKVRFYLKPVKDGDAFFGDSADFALGALEQAMHGLRNLDGLPNTRYWHGPDTYRLTVESTGMPYYRCKAELLTWTIADGQFVWKSRSQPRRIAKDKFHQMIVEGKLRRIK